MTTGGPVHRELVVVARVVDVQVGVQDVSDVLHLQAVLLELGLHALPSRYQPFIPRFPMISGG
jgi:hypothetical protein